MQAHLKIDYGSLDISRLCLNGVPAGDRRVEVSVGTEKTAARLKRTGPSAVVSFGQTVVLNAGQTLNIVFRWMAS